MKSRQFFSLLLFNAGMNPLIWIFPLALAFPFLVEHQFDGLYHPSLDFLLPVQNLFIVAIVGVWALAPEMAQTRFSRGTTAFSGTEFLLTRAVDRSCVYRARAAFLFLLVFLFPVAAIVHALGKPDLLISENSKTVRAACLQNVPGAQAQPNPGHHREELIFLPRGNVLVHEWQLWYFVSALVVVQLLLMLIAPLRFRLFIFYASIFLVIFGPLFIKIRDISSHALTFEEAVFFFFASHQVLFWTATVVAWILCQLVCETRFTRQEF